MKRQPHAKNQPHKNIKAKKQTLVPRGCMLFPPVNGKQVESVDCGLIPTSA